jgi:23S rRNA (uridine2552-2'-O)-methyltransferase
MAVMPYYRRHMKVTTKSKKVNKAWLNDHVNDPYVKLAQREGYRARAAYKLKEIDEALRLMRPGQVVVDLGSAPGAWSQYLRRRFAPGRRAAVGELDGTHHRAGPAADGAHRGRVFIQGDFREDAVAEQLSRAIGRPAGGRGGVGHGAQPVGHRVNRRGAHRAPGRTGGGLRPATPAARGALVCKVFHGSGYSQLVSCSRQHFRVVKPIKPKASRDKSAETFLVGMGLKAP